MKEQKARPIKTEGYILNHQVTARREQRRFDADHRLRSPKKSISALRFRISCAGSESEILDLLSVGKSYIETSAKTRRAWVATAAHRRACLQSAIPVRK